MIDFRTNETLRNEFLKNIDSLHDWQCKKLKPIRDLSYVITNLLKLKFVVEIDGHKYDISFGSDSENGEIGYGWSSYPSPHIYSNEIIEKAFKEGKWYEVTDEYLPIEIIEQNKTQLEELKKKKLKNS